MSQSATPATLNDMTTGVETFEKERFCSFPQRHGISDPTTTPRWRDDGATSNWRRTRVQPPDPQTINGNPSLRIREKTMIVHLPKNGKIPKCPVTRRPKTAKRWTRTSCWTLGRCRKLSVQSLVWMGLAQSLGLTVSTKDLKVLELRWRSFCDMWGFHKYRDLRVFDQPKRVKYWVEQTV